MIRYTKLLEILDEKGLNKNFLRKNGVNPTQLDMLLKHGMDKGIENRICKILGCQPGDFMEYVPDDTQEENH